MTEPDQPSGGNSSRPDIRNQRFLILSPLFPPDVLGGAEMSAANLAQWLREKGADVGVLTTAKAPQEALDGREVKGLKIWRAWMPRAYPQYYAMSAKKWLKPLWHLQDHIDPRNRGIVARVLRIFNPDYILIHGMQGLGYNALREVARSGVPTVYFLHDLSLTCVRMGMFKNGKECKKRCAACWLSSLYKTFCFKGFSALRFCSPSRANIALLSRFFPVRQWPHAAILNANSTPVPTAARTESDSVRILYVGRLHSTKGVDVLLEAASKLASRYTFTLTVVGAGPDEEKLRAQYGTLPWCHFAGFVSQQEISNFMINSDVLCIPSVWAENSPGVVIHALSLGLPVIGSDKAGIPELVEEGKNGMLVPPGDTTAWQTALEKILENPSILTPWRNYALEKAAVFDQDYIGDRFLNFLVTPQ